MKLHNKDIRNFDLAFHKDNADERKEWIAKWRDVTQIEDVVSVDLKDILKGIQNIDENDYDTSKVIVAMNPKNKTDLINYVSFINTIMRLFPRTTLNL